MSRRWPVLLSLVAGCSYPAGRYPLEALPGSDSGTGNALTSARVALEHDPTTGWALVLDLVVEAERGARPLVDLSRVLLRSDRTAWVPCHLPPEDDPALLRFRLEEEERLQLVLRCVEVRRPERRLDVRVPLSGAGGKGYVDLVFSGVQTTGDPDDLD
jgi:hypothetical protein